MVRFSARISAAVRFGVRHIAAGDLLQAEARAGTPDGREIAAYQERGDLVPDHIVFDVLTPVVVAVTAEVEARLSRLSMIRRA